MASGGVIDEVLLMYLECIRGGGALGARFIVNGPTRIPPCSLHFIDARPLYSRRILQKAPG